MKPLIFSLVFLGLLCAASAQKTLLFAPDTGPGTPPWALLMYAPEPNAALVDSAYRAWYAEHDFIKTTHTQYYKKWRRSVEPYVQPDGSIRYPAAAEQRARDAQWLSRWQQAPKSLNPQWRHIGPAETFNTFPGQVKVSWQANVYCIDQSPIDPDILFCGTEAGGIYKTTDKGLNWVHSSVNTLMRAVHSIKIDPANPQVVYAGDGANVYKTTDGGQNWQAVLHVPNFEVNDISINSANSNIVLVAGMGGLYRSVNGGQSWSPLFSESCWDIEVHPTQPHVVYLLKTNPAQRRCEFFKSDNFGAAFSIRTNGWYTSSDAARRDDGARMTVTPADPNRVYAVLIGNSKPGDNGFIGVFRSSDAGESWTLPNPPVGGPWTSAHPNLMTLNNTNTLYQGYYNLSIAASHINADHVLIGGLNLWKTENGAQTFTALGGYQGISDWIHPDQQEIKILGNDMWVANDGGINYSTDLFATHESRKKGIIASDFWGFGSGWNEDLLVGGRYHNGNTAGRNTFPAGQFLRLGGAEAPTGYVNPGIAGKAYFSDLNTHIIPNGFSQQVPELPPLSNYPSESYFPAHSSEMEFHPLCYRHIYIGKDNQLWRSENEGASFQLIKTFEGSTGPVLHFEISRSNPDVIYVYQRTTFYGARLWKTADGGASWQALNFPFAPSQRAGTMSLSATDENTLWVAFGHQSNDGAKVYKTTDGGLSWQNLSTPLLDGHTIHYIFHQAGTDGAVYIGTDYAVFYRDNSMSDWEPFYDGLPAATNCNIMRPFYKTGKLRMATYSQGIWEADLKTPSAPLAQPMADKRLSMCARDTFYFDDYSVLNHTGASWRWAFPGAAWVSDSTARNPKVVFGQTGLFDVTLTITDASGASHSKTVPGMIHIPEDACRPDTIPGFALRLGGSSSDYAVAPPLNTPTNTFTVSAWIRRNGNQNANAGIFFSRGGNTAAGLNFGNNNELRYHWSNNFWNWNSGLIVPDGEWAHVAMVVEPTRATLYLNGVPAVNNGIHPFQSFPGETYIGADPNFSARRFNGLIEEVCVWRRALSMEEIRGLRHLSKRPQDDPTILAYYQFNEPTGDALDRARVRHARLNGAATRLTSTCPVGGGVSARQEVAAPGEYAFQGTDLTLVFPASGALPGGEVVVTRINLPPDQLVSDAPHSRAYWVINNYGANTAFAPPVSAAFGRIGPVGGAEAAMPAAFRLYTRRDNADGNTWQLLGPASQMSAGPDGAALFGPEAPIAQSGQFVVARDGAPVSALTEERMPYPFSIYPNPVERAARLTIATEWPEAYLFTLFDGQGRRVWRLSGRGTTSAVLPDLPTGLYAYRIEAGRWSFFGKVLVN